MKVKLLITSALCLVVLMQSCKKNENPVSGTNEESVGKKSMLSTNAWVDQTVTNFFKRTTGSVAFDQGNSIPLSDGRVLWVTQDAYYQGSLSGNYLYCNHTISYTNSIIIQPTKTNWSSNAPMMTRTGTVHNIGNMIPVQPGNTWTWPGAGVEIGNHVYIYAAEGNGLNPTNQALYKLTKSSGTAWNTAPVRLTPNNMSGQVEALYSAGMVKESDGYVYCFGQKGTNFGYNSDIFVARFHESNPSAWTYWDGFVWNTNRCTCAITTSLAANSVAKVNGKYVLCTITSGFNCDGNGGVYTSFSSSPTGPWSPRKLVYTINETFKGDRIRYYTPIIHPESTAGGLLITYSVNFGACQQVECTGTGATRDPNYYRPRAITVPLSEIGI